MTHSFPNLQAALMAALTAYQQGDFGAGVGACDNALTFDPRHPDGLHIRALCLSKLGQIEAADAGFSAAAAVGHPSLHEVLTNHAAMLLAAGQSDRAQALAHQGVTIKPGFAMGWLVLAKAYQALGQKIAAAEAYQSSLLVHPSLGPARTGYADLLTQMDQPEAAQTLLAQELDQRPANHIALNNMATLNRRQGQIEQAVMVQEKAAQAAPQNPDIVANLARLYQRVGRLEPALAAYETALALAPQEIDTHKDYNKLLWEMDRRETYLTSYDRAVRVSQPIDQHGLLMAKAALATQVGDYSQAMAALAPLSADGPEQASLLAERAKIHQGLGELADAEAAFRTALKTAPDNIVVAHDAAEFLLGRSAFAEAEHILGKFYHSYDGGTHLQRHLALRALALRGLGDDRYQYWYDYDRCTTKRQMEVPKGYGTLDSFMAAVVEALEPLFQTDIAPLDQTLFGGVQSPGNLWETSDPVLLDLKQALFDTAMRFVAELPHEPDHPFFQRRPKDPRNMTFSAAWAVKLARGGGHVDHYHPAGWISSATYISVPKSVTDSPEKAGWLRLGASGVTGLSMAAERHIKPEAGHQILFPSYLWHGVEVFSDDQPRITTPFDLLPIN